MTRWFLLSAIYAVMFTLSGKFTTVQSVGSGMLIGLFSIVCMKVFGLDKDT